MKKLLVLFLLVLASLSFLFAGEKTVYPVHVKWTVSVFSGKIEPLGEDPYEVEITVEENNTCSLLSPALYMSPDYPPTESGVLEGVSYCGDKKGDVALKYVFAKEEQVAGMTLNS
ncbi:MAG: hypothetical protein KBS81_09320, partial [Spirochaetales bacterium]|nr:hypothetical protein [Candidatus Physcosoma equi]